MKLFQSSLDSNSTRGNIVITFFALLSSFTPVSAQLDQQWKRQESGITECRIRFKNAQYSSSDSHRYYVDKSGFISNVHFAFGTCSIYPVSQINEEIEGTRGYSLHKVEGNQLIKYFRPFGFQREVRRSVMGTKR